MCGAAAATDATSCEHCGARLAMVACPSCFGMMFTGQQFCPHCGAKADRLDIFATPKPEPCPRCKTNMEPVVVGGNKLRECPRCEGTWTDVETLRLICADREQQAAVLGMATRLPTNEGVAIEKQIRYLPCPNCGQLMNRVNFANFSNVIVDVCRQHGTWFDRDELRRIVEFIRGGGLEKARAREKSDLEQDRRMAAVRGFGGQSISGDLSDAVKGNAVFEIAQSVIDILIR
jgi:Zn-finger nucleic acid-binding protein